jgi:hypothetical protein
MVDYIADAWREAHVGQSRSRRRRLVIRSLAARLTVLRQRVPRSAGRILVCGQAAAQILGSRIFAARAPEISVAVGRDGSRTFFADPRSFGEERRRLGRDGTALRPLVHARRGPRGFADVRGIAYRRTLVPGPARRADCFSMARSFGGRRSAPLLLSPFSIAVRPAVLGNASDETDRVSRMGP